MSSINAQIAIADRMSSPLHNIISAVEQTISALQGVDGAVSQGFDTGAFDNARRSIDLANVELEEMAANTRQNTTAQERYNRTVHEGSSAMAGLGGKVFSMVAAYASFQGVQKLVALSDATAQTTARLNMMNDGLQTTKELQDKIFASAQRSRAAYQATADMVARLGTQAGDAFGSNDELIAFSEALNKSFVLSGANAQAVESVMYNLTQALSSGVLRGQDLNAVFSNAPSVIQNIADYLDVPRGQIRAMAKDGELSAEVVKNAMLAAAGDINTQFESMPMTWAQVWTGVMNRMTKASEPLLGAISTLAQSWAIIEPLVIGVVVALGAYVVVLGIYNGLKAASAIAESVHAAAIMLATEATFAQTAAQYGLNAAILASPITWVLLVIIAIIAAIYAVVAAINKVTGSTLSATGIIVGALAVAAAFIANIFISLVNFVIDAFTGVWNFIAIFANFFANAFNDPVGANVRLFFDLADTVLSILQSIAGAIDTVFGQNLSGTVQGWRDSLKSKVEGVYGSGIEVMSQISAADFHLGRFEYENAFKEGYNFGNSVGGKGGAGDIYDDFSSMAWNLEDIAGNTGSMADSMAITEEDLKYLRDFAEQETINRFTTAEIRVEMNNNNSISSGMDIDGMINDLAVGVNEAMERAAEGVHA